QGGARSRPRRARSFRAVYRPQEFRRMEEVAAFSAFGFRSAGLEPAVAWWPRRACPPVMGRPTLSPAASRFAKRRRCAFRFRPIDQSQTESRARAAVAIAQLVRAE